MYLLYRYMIPFNYHHLYYFYTIAREGSVSKAAVKLRLGQPTLSSQLKQFEQYLDTRLFEREAKKLKLTEDGRYLLGYATDLFSLGQDMLDGFHDRSKKKGGIRLELGVADYVPKSIVDALLQFILKSFPETFISVREHDLDRMLNDLDDYALDLVLADAPSPASHTALRSQLAGSLPVHFCASKTMANRVHSLKDLDGMPMLLPSPDSQIYRGLRELFLNEKIEPKIVGEIQDTEAIRRLALSSFGIAALNTYTLTHAPDHEKLKVLDLGVRQNIMESAYLLYRPRKRPHPVVSGVLSQFRLAASQ